MPERVTILGVEHEVIRRTAQYVTVRRVDGDRIPFHGSEATYPASALGQAENVAPAAAQRLPQPPPASTVDRKTSPVTVTWEPDTGDDLRLF